MRSPTSVCWRMIRHSTSSSAPGLWMMSSGTATLPMSCSSAARASDVELLGVEPELAPGPHRQLGDVGHVAAQLRLALGQHLDEHVARLPPAVGAA